MSDHNITPQFGSINEDPKKPWYKKPLTYAIGVPVILISGLVGAINGGADSDSAGGKRVVKEPLKTESAEPFEPAPEPAPVEVEPAPTTEEMALIVLREGWPYYETVSDANINSAAIIACDSFDSGMTWEGYMAVALNSGMPSEEAGALAGYAANVYCTQHLDIAEGH